MCGDSEAHRMRKIIRYIHSICPRSARNYLVFLTSPFLLLLRSRGLSAFYAIGLVVLTLVCLEQMNTYLVEYMRWLHSEPSFPNWLVPHFQAVLTAALIFVMVPVSIVAWLLPLRLQYHSHGRVPILRLLSETLPALVRCSRGMCSLLRAHYRVFIPLCCLAYLLHLSQTVPQLAPMKYFYLTAVIVLVVMLFQKALSLLLGPILIVVGDIDAEFAIGSAAHVIRTGYAEVCLVLGLGLSLLVTSYSMIDMFTVVGTDGPLLQVSVAFLILWYIATLLGLICLRRTHCVTPERLMQSSA